MWVLLCWWWSLGFGVGVFGVDVCFVFVFEIIVVEEIDVYGKY